MFTYCVNMSPLVLGPVRGVRESLVAMMVHTDVRTFSCMAPQMDFQVLQARESLGAAFEL